jgi:GNAT superfamily N-acetyltransferase
VAENQISPTLDKAIRAFLCTCFPNDVTEFQRTRHWHGSAPAYSILLTVAGSIQGHIGIVIRTIRSGGRPVAVAGVQNLCIHPQMRGSGLAATILTAAMAEARRRGLGFGLLFCDRSLEQFYKTRGWSTLDVPVMCADENGHHSRIPDKNICMVSPLNAEAFPEGAIDLQGPDW